MRKRDAVLSRLILVGGVALKMKCDADPLISGKRDRS